MNGLYVDLIFFAVIILFCIIGYFKGFLRSLLSLFGFVGCAFVAYISRDFISEILANAFSWETSISQFLSKQVANISPTLAEVAFSEQASMIEAINASDIGLIYKKIFESMILKVDFAGEILTVAEAVVQPLTNLLMEVISVVLVFIVLRIIIFILNRILKAIPRKSVFGRIDSKLGILVGFVNGLLVLSGVFALVNVLVLVPSVAETLTPIINDSTVVKFLLGLFSKYVI